MNMNYKLSILLSGTIPDLGAEQVDDNFLNPVDDKLSGLHNEAMDGDVVKQADEQVADKAVGTGELAPKINYNITAENAAASSMHMSP
jgi:hypothetical protein